MLSSKLNFHELRDFSISDFPRAEISAGVNTRNVFCAFAVTLLARPKKRHADTHSFFASPSCDEQFIVGRKVVLIGFFGNLHRRFLIKSPCRPCPLSSQKTVTAGFYMRRVHIPTTTRYSRG